jgi:hypothetical protein
VRNATLSIVVMCYHFRWSNIEHYGQRLQLADQVNLLGNQELFLWGIFVLYIVEFRDEKVIMWKEVGKLGDCCYELLWGAF